MIKTIHVSEVFWRRLKVVAAERGVTVRQVLEEIGDEFLARHPAGFGPGRPTFTEATQREIQRLSRAGNELPPTDSKVRELKVELEGE